MMNIVAHNLLAMNANRQFGITNKKKAKSTEKLSSGYKINRAADDAAGLSISEKMRRQIRGLSKATENIQDGISLCQVADGALTEVHEMLQRINELAVKAANGTNTVEDRHYIQQEIDQLKNEIDRIGKTTTFNEIKIFEPDERANDLTNIGSSHIVKKETGTHGNLDWTFSCYVDYSDYANKIQKFDIQFTNGNYYFSANTLLNNIIDTGMKINAGDKLILYEEHTGYNGKNHLHDMYILNENTNQKKLFAKWQKNMHNGKTGSEENYLLGAGPDNLFYVITRQDALTDSELDGFFANKENFNFTFVFSDSNNVPPASEGDSSSQIESNNVGKQIWIQMGVEPAQGMFIEIGSMNTSILGIKHLKVSTEEEAAKGITQVKKAIQMISEQRSRIGAEQNRLEHAYNINMNIAENTTDAESRIRDTDVAKEMLTFSNENILAQAGSSMLSQANQSQQNILSLLS